MKLFFSLPRNGQREEDGETRGCRQFSEREAGIERTDSAHRTEVRERVEARI